MSAHMSGWDVSSTPTWGPQDGPEDTQAFTGQDGPPPEFFGQEHGQEQELGPGGY